MNTSKNEALMLVLKGMAMGIAEVIPGVSGGTIAFITGIYERLLHSIKAVLGPGLIATWRQGGFKNAWAHIDGAFLVYLLAGMGAGVVLGVFGVSHLLQYYPQLLWAFFFGLIVASAIYVGRKVGRWTWREYVAGLLAAGLALAYTLVAPAQGIQALWFVFVCGVIAISALMLPGISGSFILVLLGMYTTILPAAKSAIATQDAQSLGIIVVFAAGCLLGLAAFSRVLTWTFKHYHNPTMAVLTGFMVGSLNKIWPWKEVISWRTNSTGESVPLLERSIWPWAHAHPMTLACMLLAIAGFLMVFLLEKADTSHKAPAVQ